MFLFFFCHSMLHARALRTGNAMPLHEHGKAGCWLKSPPDTIRGSEQRSACPKSALVLALVLAQAGVRWRAGVRVCARRRARSRKVPPPRMGMMALLEVVALGWRDCLP